MSDCVLWWEKLMNRSFKWSCAETLKWSDEHGRKSSEFIKTLNCFKNPGEMTSGGFLLWLEGENTSPGLLSSLSKYLNFSSPDNRKACTSHFFFCLMQAWTLQGFLLLFLPTKMPADLEGTHSGWCMQVRHVRVPTENKLDNSRVCWRVCTNGSDFSSHIHLFPLPQIHLPVQIQSPLTPE